MPSLESPNLKVQRAKEYLDSLNGAIKSYRQSKPYRISSQDDLEAGEWVITIEMEDPPLLLGLVAGDFICCLRSSLEWLAWQLAALSNAYPSDAVCFPICGQDSARTQRYIIKSTEGIPQDAITIMKQLQPYTSGNAYKTTHLWRLNKLWNIDKHRHIPFHSVFVQVNFPGMPCTTPMQTAMLNKVYSVRFPLSAKQEMNLDPRMGIDVNFGDEREGISLNIQDFFDIYEFVSQKVIPSFAGFFA
jgi:hypothetical protein